MRARTTWTLLLLLLLAAAWFFGVEEPRRRGRMRSRGSRTILPYLPGEVDSLVFVNPDGDTIAAVRTTVDRWVITRPVVTPGQTSMFELLLRQLVPGQKLEEFDSIEDFAAYGLNDPHATVILFNGERGRVDTIRVGDRTPTGPRAYARVNSEPAVIVARDIMFNTMRKNLFHLRDKNFTHIPAASIVGITVQDGDTRLSFSRERMSWWRTGPRYPVRTNWMDGYISTLVQAIIRSFDAESTDSLEGFGLSDPNRRLFIDTGDEIITIDIGRLSGETVYVRRDGLDKVVSLRTGDILGIFRIDPDELRARELAFYDPRGIAGFRWISPDTSLSLLRRNGEWIDAGSGAPVRNSAVTGLIEELRRIRFDAFLEESFEKRAASIGDIVVEIELTDSTGTAVDRIVVAAPRADHEIGGSRSSGTLGRLPALTSARLRRRFEQIGAGPRP